jgi:8-oxo-dGTP diphosphatase
LDQFDHDTRLGVYAVLVDDDDRILLALWNEAREPKWTMPGGGVDFHESLAQALVREVMEETGYLVEPGELLGVDTAVIRAAERFVPSDRDVKAIRVVYEARIIGGALTHEEAGTTDEARWFPFSEVGDLKRVHLVDTAIRFWRARHAGADPVSDNGW